MPITFFHGDGIPVTLPALATEAVRRLPRVLCVFNLNPTDKFGSLEEQIVFLHRAFKEEGSRFLPLFTFPPRKDGADAFRAHGVESRCLDMQRFRIGTLLALRKLIRAEQIDVVHWHFTDPICNPYLWWLSVVCPGVRHYYSDHISRLTTPYTPPSGLKRFAKRLLLKRYSQTWCVSQFVHDCLSEQKSWSNVHVCPHFINTMRFTPNSRVRERMRHEHGADDRFIISVIAQLIPEKGIDVVLRAMTEIPEQAVLWIVGAGHQAATLQAMSQNLGLEHRVRFFGLQREVQPFLQAADCFVLASRWKEAAGLVLLEAQASGLPVVASRIGGIPEYVEDGQTGLLFSAENAGELAGHIRTLCDDPDRCRRMGREARSMVLQRFTPESQLADWLELYRQ